jgi:hypothetical protein
MNVARAAMALERELPSFDTHSVVQALAHARRLVRQKGKAKRRLQRSLLYRWNKWMAVEVQRATEACIAAELQYNTLRNAYIFMSVSTAYREWEVWQRDMWEYEQGVVKEDARDAEAFDDEDSVDENDRHSIDFYHKLPQKEDVSHSMDAWRTNREERMRLETRQPDGRTAAEARVKQKEDVEREDERLAAEALREAGRSRLSKWARSLPKKVSSVFRQPEGPKQEGSWPERSRSGEGLGSEDEAE